MDVFQKPSQPPEFPKNREVGFGGHSLTEKPMPGKRGNGETADGKLFRDSSVLGLRQPEGDPARQIFLFVWFVHSVVCHFIHPYSILWASFGAIDIFEGTVINEPQILN
jgi:hypothetical protein